MRRRARCRSWASATRSLALALSVSIAGAAVSVAMPMVCPARAYAHAPGDWGVTGEPADLTWKAETSATGYEIQTLPGCGQSRPNSWEKWQTVPVGAVCDARRRCRVSEQSPHVWHRIRAYYGDGTGRTFGPWFYERATMECCVLARADGDIVAGDLMCHVFPLVMLWQGGIPGQPITQPANLSSSSGPVRVGPGRTFAPGVGMMVAEARTP